MLIHDLLGKSLRMGERSLAQFRDITFAHFDSHLAVQTSSSCIYIFFSKTPCKPFMDRPSEGILQITMEKGKRSDILLSCLYRVYTKSRCLALGDLCIRFGQEAHLVSIDICPIQTDGDLLRLSIAGVNEAIRVLGLRTFFVPVCLSYCSLSGALVADPDEQELQYSSWSANIVMKSTREVLYVEKTGDGIAQEDMLGVLDRAFADAKMLSG